MSTDKYTIGYFPVSSILSYIKSGDIAIPEIQRPFVWKPRDVRNLIDSLYNGYPTGYLIIWQNPDVKLKDGGSSVGKKILIDGQQRVTALMTAINGQPVLNDDYEEKIHRIAFNPWATGDEERFAVQTPAHVKSRHWIPDISVIFRDDFDSYSFIEEYAARNPEVNRSTLNRAITELQSIKTRQLGAITLVPQLDISEVTEIFVRINSQGKRLNEADFAMSKIAADEKFGGNMLRKAIDYFCHLAVDPAFYSKLASADRAFMSSDYEPRLRWLKDDKESIYDPDYNDMLRVSFMHKFGRGKLGDLVGLLSGRDFETRTYKEDIAASSFAHLTEGVKNFMHRYNLENFVLAIKSLGFISNSLLNSKMTLDFAYTLFLLLQQSEEIPKIEIKHWVQKWFVLSTLTGRYINSPETQMDHDMRGITHKGFREFFKENESAVLSDTFWSIGLVQNLETSSINSPYFNTFLAAQIFNGERSLFSSTSKVSDLISVTGDVHHIFPREFLKQNGIADRAVYNQVANYTYLDTAVNIAVGKKAPAEYFSAALVQCDTKELKIGTITDATALQNNFAENCIPAGIERMQAQDYELFLANRRKLMAEKIKAFYYAI